MRYTDPFKLALTNALLVTLIYSAAHVAASLIYFKFSISALLLIDAILFFTVYFLLRYTVEKFIYNKIRLIYKTIYNLKRHKGEKLDKREDSVNTIESVNQEVLEWGEKKKLEIEELKRTEVYRREFLGNIYHELKNPIFNIQGYILTLLDGGLEDKTINREYLLRTEKSINRMIAIVDDLETISNLETSQVNMKLSRFDIVDLTKDAFDFLELKAKKKKKTLIISDEHDSPIYIHADKKWIRQVMVNLIDNSIKYGRPKSGKTIVSFFDMDENILIEVTDDGQGVNTDDIPRLFERFFRTSSARSRDKVGTGLGLSIVKHIIESHDQTINVRSREGVGTTFAFTLKKA